MTKARVDQPATTDDLSESARAVVRDAGDPRIDAHLRAMGLAPDPAGPTAATTPAPPAVAPEPGEAPEVVALRTRVVELEALVAASGRQVRLLAVALAGALVTAAILAVLVVSRLG